MKLRNYTSLLIRLILFGWFLLVETEIENLENLYSNFNQAIQINAVDNLQKIKLIFYNKK